MYDYESNRSQGERAANKLLAQTLPAHGNHAGSSAHSASHDAAGPGSIVIPSRAVPTPEKSGAVIEAKLAINVQRRGTVQAAAGYAQRVPAIEDNFTAAFSEARATDAPQYEKRIAYGRSPLAGAPYAQPTWATPNVERSTPDFLGSAIANGEAHKLNPRAQELRPGSTPYNHTRIDRLDLTSKPKTSYGYTWGTSDKQQLRRHNEAEVRD